MSETTIREETKREKPAKRGLHGWKAALAVFGCGTLAAFGVFGVIVGLLSTLVSTVSEGISPSSQEPPISSQSVTPREEFVDDKFDLCGRTLPSIRDLNLIFTDSGSGYEDSGVDGGGVGEEDLVRSDQCAGTLAPAGAYMVPWDFEFVYRAIIYSPGGDREDLASEDMISLQEQVESEMSVTESGSGDLGDESRYYYGSLQENEESIYVVVVRQRSATYMISLSSTDDVSSSNFSSEARKFGPQLEITLGSRIPE
ncbi:hypothetical protein [Nocardiopsis alba]|uniref:hypothetical protein n=1 Tax=Nocardiopsis alba TaxID=53437 RepID=UPI0036C2EDCD